MSGCKIRPFHSKQKTKRMVFGTTPVECLEGRVLLSTTYAATPIGAFNSVAITANGDVAGTTFAGHAVLYHAGTGVLTDLETTDFSNSGTDVVYGLSANDAVVLQHTAKAGGAVTYWEVSSLGKIAIPGASSGGLFIDAQGQVAGTAANGGANFPALWTNVAGVYKMSFLPTLVGSIGGTVTGFNDTGHVTGTESTTSPNVNSTPNPAFLASATAITELPATSSFILQETTSDIADNGWVVGTNYVPPTVGPRQASLWEGDVNPIFLGSLTGSTGSSTGIGVNSQGVVVGTTSIATAPGIGAFVWTASTGMKALQPITTGLPSGATLLPVGINDAGTILATNAQNGEVMELKPGTAVPTTGSISGKVFLDTNNNGTLDAGEAGVAGATVFLNLNGTGNPTGQPQTQTGSDGSYSFSNVKTGVTEVQVIPPVVDADGKPGVEAPVTVVGGQTVTLNRAVVVAVPAITVTGNSMAIVNGAIAPLTTNTTAFGNVFLGQTKTVTFDITNVGTLPLTLSGTPAVVVTGVSNSEFKLSKGPTTLLKAGYYTAFLVQFAPTTASTASATITLNTNDPQNRTFKFTINGTGVQSTVVNGTYTGTVSNKTDGSYATTFIFSSQNTKANSIYGSLSIPKYLGISTKGTFTGSVAADGTFTFKRSTSLATATLVGKESADGKTLTGTLTYDSLLASVVFNFTVVL